MNSILRYVAFGSKGTTHSLAQEITSIIGNSTKIIPQIDSVQFVANQKQLLDICFKSHLIQNLKVQIAGKFQASTQKELADGLSKLPLHAFISNLEQPLNYSLKCSDAHIKSFSAHRILQRYLSDKKFSPNSNQQVNHVHNKGLVQVQNNILELSISNKYARLYTPVNKTLMYKHGWKTKVNYAPLRESLAASILYDSGIIPKAKKNKSLKLWDPFCGSGTFILQAISLYCNLPVRSDGDWMMCTDWPCFDNNLLQQYKRKLDSSISPCGEMSLVASDIDLSTINMTLQNYRKMQLNLQGFKTKRAFINRSPHHKLFTASENQLYFAAQDFQTVGKEIIDTENMTILANLPYGHRSRQKTNKPQLMSIYKRFDRFLKQQKQKFKEAFLILPTASSFNEHHFLTMSEQKWKLKNCYSSGGKEVGLYELTREASILVNLKNIEPTDIVKQTQENQTSALQVIQKTNKQMKINTKLPSYKIPKKPKRGKDTVRWKRNIHEMRQDFKQHAIMRSERQELKQFQSQKIKERRVKKGMMWREKNIQKLGDRIQDPKYVKKISSMVQNKVKRAVVDLQKQKQRKQRKKSINKGKDINVRKW